MSSIVDSIPRTLLSSQMIEHIEQQVLMENRDSLEGQDIFLKQL